MEFLTQHPILLRLKPWFAPPVFPGDEDKTARARILNTVGLYFALGLDVAIILVPVYAQRKLEVLAILLALLLLLCMTRYFILRGRLALATTLTIASAWTLFVVIASISGGIFSPLMFAVMGATMAIGLLLEPRVGSVFAIASILAGLGLSILQQSGSVLFRYFIISPMAAWFLFSLSLLFMHGTMTLTVRDLQKALRRGREEAAARRLAEVTLRASEKRHHDLFENAGLAAIQSTLDGTILAVNLEFARVFGYQSPEEVCAKVKNATEFYADPQRRAEILRRRAQDPSLNKFEIVYLRKDGSTFVAQLTLRTFLDPEGRSHGVEGFIEDVTQRIQAEQAVQRRNTELAALNQLGQSLGRLAEPSEILEHVFSSIGRLLGNRNLYIALIDEPRQRLSFPVYTMNGERLDVSEQPFGNYATEYVMRTNEPLLIKCDLEETFDRLGIERFGTASRSFLAVPMCGGDRVIGVIALQDYDRQDAYDEHDVELLTTVAAQATIALENARLFGAVQQELEERKRVEKALRESEQRFRQLFESHKAVMLLIQPDSGVIVDANPAAIRFYGYTREQLCGMPIEEINVLPPEQVTIERQRASNAERDFFIFPHRKADGEIRTVQVRSSPIDTRDGRLLFSIVEDVTEREQAQQALQASERRFRALIEKSLDIITILNLDGTARYESPAHEQLLGYTSEEMIGQYPMTLVHPDDLAPLAQVFAEHIGTHGYTTRIQYRMRHKDGSWREMESVVRNMIDDPVINGIVINSRDVTENNAAQRALFATQERNRRIVETAHEGIVAFDADWRISYANARMAEIYEYDIRDIIGKRLDEIILQDDPGSNVEHRASREMGMGGTFEKSFRTRSGHRAWVLISASPIMEGGKFDGSFAMVTDITERKLAEQALQISEQSARQTAARLQMVNQIGIAITAGLDSERQMEILYQQSRQIGDTDTFYVALYDDTTGIITFPYSFKDGGRLPYSSRNIHENPGVSGYIINHRQTLHIPDLSNLPSGMSAIWLPGERTRSFVGIPLILNDRVIGVMSAQSQQVNAYTDEQIHTLELLATQVAIMVQNSQLYEQVEGERNLANALIDNLPGAFSLIDQHRHLIRWNKFTETLLGYSADEIKSLDVLSIITEQDRAWMGDLVAQVLTGRQISAETRLIVKGGEREIPLFLTGSPIKIGSEDHLLGMGIDITERKKREHELECIAQLSSALRVATTRAQMLPIVLDHALDMLEVEGASLAIRNPVTGRVTHELGRGLWESMTGVQLSRDESLSGRVMVTGESYVTTEFKSDPLLSRPDLIGDLNCAACVPLAVQKETFGALWVGRRAAIHEDELRLLTSIADIAANAIHRATLHELAERAANDLVSAYDTTLEGWAHALEMRDQETEGHTRRVTQMTLELARAMGVPEREMEDIRRGALLHDIGKMGIPDSVLLKPGTLNDREWEIMRRHPEYAHEWLASIQYLSRAVDIPYCHHEKWDGSGYPRALKDEQIPLAARIFAVVDVWDALTSDRPYRKAWAKTRAREYIVANQGSHFDPQVVQAFLALITAYDGAEPLPDRDDVQRVTLRWIHLNSPERSSRRGYIWAYSFGFSSRQSHRLMEIRWLSSSHLRFFRRFLTLLSPESTV